MKKEVTLTLKRFHWIFILCGVLLQISADFCQLFGLSPLH